MGGVSAADRTNASDGGFSVAQLGPSAQATASAPLPIPQPQGASKADRPKGFSVAQLSIITDIVTATVTAAAQARLEAVTAAQARLEAVTVAQAETTLLREAIMAQLVSRLDPHLKQPRQPLSPSLTRR